MTVDRVGVVIATINIATACLALALGRYELAAIGFIAGGAVAGALAHDYRVHSERLADRREIAPHLDPKRMEEALKQYRRPNRFL